jgi:IMP dehydrogenase
MATCGYEDIPAFHKAEVMVAPALQSEGKQLQRDQEIGMGATAAAAAAPPSADGVSNGAPPEISTPSTDPVIETPVDEVEDSEPVAAAPDPAGVRE